MRGKLALLVAVLIICQIVFILVMWSFWRQTKLELRRQLRAKEVVEQVESIRLKERQVLLSLAAIPPVDGCERKIVEARTGTFFKEQVARFDELAPKMVGLNQHLRRVAEQLDSINSGSVEHPGAGANQLAAFRLTMQCMDELLDEMKNRFKDYHREHAERVMLDNTVEFVYMGLCSIGVTFCAIFATITFAQSLDSKVAVLVANAEREASGEPLLPPLKGRDELTAIDAAFRRMTEALRAESENLRLSEAKVRTIVETLPVGLLLVGSDQKIDTANAAAAELLGVNGIEVLRACLLEEFFPDGVGPAVQETPCTQLARKSTGERFPVEVLKKSYTTAGGESMLLIFQDISDREKMRQLREEFVAVVSHEIRTPLTSVRAFLFMLQKGLFGSLNHDGVDYVRRMDSVTRRLVALVNELVAAGKIELGHLSLEIETHSFQEMLDEALSSVAAMAEQADVSFKATEREAVVLCDRQRTAQVLINLLSNAVKYSDSGALIEIDLETIDNRARILVKDEGAGIPEEDLSRIFDKFEQVKARSHRRKNSSGLGLYIAKDIVERQGGEIGVSSKTGQGSVFWFTVPLAEANDATGGL